MPDLADLVSQQARTNALLEALTYEVRKGFADGREEFADHRKRLKELEHAHTRQKTFLAVLSSGAVLGGLSFLLERMRIWPFH